MKKICLFILVVFITTGLFAQSISFKDAEKVAKSHYFQSLSSAKSSKSVKWDNIQLELQANLTKEAGYNFHVFNVNKDEGFIIVSSDAKIKPVLAYSLEGPLDYNNMSPAQKAYFQYFNDCIEFASENEFEVSEKVKSEWRELLEFDPYLKSFATKSTSPILLGEINWNQTWPYNAMCPEDAAATGSSRGHTPVGCVATSMVQVMKYYNWPPNGAGSKNHNGGYGSVSVNFAQETYDWYTMPDKASSKYNEDLAKINYHTGVAVSMSWGPEGSGTNCYIVPAAFKNYFKYDEAVRLINKSSQTEESWAAMIIAQIDAKRPIIYSGLSTTTGHAWNCDGYQGDDYFHMNWGWGGAGNCYCTTDELISSATVGGPANNFNLQQQIVIDIFPNGDYNSSCIGSKTIKGFEGSFDDGSSVNNYQANASCVYVINPDCGRVINCKFTKFELGNGDVVSFYNGDENSDQLIGSFDANNLPGNQTISSNTGAMTIRFTSDESSEAEGWKIKYDVLDCSTDAPIFINASGSFDDGSGPCEYIPGHQCLWRIEPTDASSISIAFSEFDLGNSGDWVRIYKDTIHSSNLIGEYKTSNLPPEELNINSGVVYVRFFSNINSAGGNGWNITYSSDGSKTDVPQNTFISEFSVVPNPGNNDSKLTFTLEKNSETRIFVTNVLGKIISDKSVRLPAGTNDIYINDIAGAGLTDGMYYINVQAEGHVRTIKFVVIN